jgi:uncharacterized membrane protein YjfL (UPF0719 family)
MDIVAKPFGAFEDEKITNPTPAGLAFVGNPQYGRWQNDDRGTSFWAWYGAYRLFGDLLGARGQPYSYRRDEWDTWSTKYRGQPYYGEDKDKHERYGTGGTVVGSSNRWASASPRCGEWRCGTAATPSAGAAVFVHPESSLHVGPIMTTVTRLGITAAYVAIVLLFMLMGRLVGNALFRSKRTNQPPNLALSVRHGGLYLAIAIAMTSALQGNTSGFVHDVVEVLRDGGVSVFALIAAQWLNEWCIVPGLDNDQAVADGNTAVALTEFGSYIATGMIASASFGGGEGSWVSAIVFFAVGQLALIAGFWAQELLLPGSFVDGVIQGREGAGVAVAGVLIALGAILRASIARTFLGWSASFRWRSDSCGGRNPFPGRVQGRSAHVFVKRRHVGDQYHTVALSVVACGQIAIALVIRHAPRCCRRMPCHPESPSRREPPMRRWSYWRRPCSSRVSRVSCSSASCRPLPPTCLATASSSSRSRSA